MKTCAILCMVAGLLSAGRLVADGPAAPPAAGSGRLSGVIRALDLEAGKLHLKDFWSTKTVNLGASCQVSLAGTNGATLGDLRPGHKVDVSFTRHDGVRVATSVVQHDQTFTGFIAAINRTNDTVRVTHEWSTRRFTVGQDCRLLRRDGSKLPFEQLEVGKRVTITYLKPGSGGDVAERIAETSREFKGRIESLDAREDVIRAANLVSRRTFRLGSDCQLVVAGELGGDLKDFRIGDTVVFHYDDIDGVPVANRIERVAGNEEPPTRRLTRQQSPES